MVQLPLIQVTGDCDCGCGTVDLSVPDGIPPAPAREPIPVEARGVGVDVLLLVRAGLIQCLEIVTHGDARPISYPTPERLELWVPPPMRGRERSV